MSQGMDAIVERLRQRREAEEVSWEFGNTPGMPAPAMASSAVRLRAVIASSGTYSLPAGITYAMIHLIGGGGGGGGGAAAGSTDPRGGGGGSAGVELTAHVVGAIGGASLTVVIGDAGAGGGVDGDGGIGTATRVYSSTNGANLTLLANYGQPGRKASAGGFNGAGGAQPMAVTVFGFWLESYLVGQGSPAQNGSDGNYDDGIMGLGGRGGRPSFGGVQAQVVGGTVTAGTYGYGGDGGRSQSAGSDGGGGVVLIYY